MAEQRGGAESSPIFPTSQNSIQNTSIGDCFALARATQRLAERSPGWEWLLHVSHFSELQETAVSYFPLLRSLRSQFCGFPKVGWYVRNGIHVLLLLAIIQVASDCVRVLPMSQHLCILSLQLLLTDCRFCCHQYCHRLATRHC